MLMLLLFCSLDSVNAKAKGLVNLVNTINAGGQVIDGIGSQTHLGVRLFTLILIPMLLPCSCRVSRSAARVVSRLRSSSSRQRRTSRRSPSLVRDALNSCSLLDAYAFTPPAELDIAQAGANDYTQVFNACLAETKCQSITLWGVRDPVRTSHHLSGTPADPMAPSRTPGARPTSPSSSTPTSKPRRPTPPSPRPWRKTPLCNRRTWRKLFILLYCSPRCGLGGAGTIYDTLGFQGRVCCVPCYVLFVSDLKTWVRQYTLVRDFVCCVYVRRVGMCEDEHGKPRNCEPPSDKQKVRMFTAMIWTWRPVTTSIRK